MPADLSEWKILRRRCMIVTTQTAIEDLLEHTAMHSRLANYVPTMWTATGIWTINTTLHNKKVPEADARVVGRLLAGGQGLRAGDSAVDLPATKNNCCVHCLLSGLCVADSLEHMLFDCPLIGPARDAGFSCQELCTHHRNQWTFSQLRAIRKFFVDANALRRQAKKNVA